MAKGRSPESQAWDLLKGKQVRIHWRHPDSLRNEEVGILAWVDHYTIGLTPVGCSDSRIVFKQDIRWIEAAVLP